MNALFTCALLLLLPSFHAHALCDRQPLDGLVEHTEYRGDVCSLSKRLLEDWRAHRTLVDKINGLSQDYLTTPAEHRTDVLMDINYHMIKLRSLLFGRLHSRLGAYGAVSLRLVNDPFASPGTQLVGYAVKFTREWREGRWPINDHVGTIEFDLTIRDFDVLGQTQLCVAEECRLYDSEGNALIAFATRAR